MVERGVLTGEVYIPGYCWFLTLMLHLDLVRGDPRHYSLHGCQLPRDQEHRSTGNVLRLRKRRRGRSSDRRHDCFVSRSVR